ncbi:hypothetical protein CERSUDRAFT_113484 [Gelatoporia subvermispora B]|uniref:C3H1-type domain-containing protein n=1 Tax=Ceriporiopsis subvermispora (strain B) TaxID=914234 RepID=M2QMQ8_CERS8|nr:hypothetical protein CERSUDRAFT_113484 [Gelatoporia subvermispora B]
MAIRCKWYNDDGQPSNGGCNRGTSCTFVHPDSPLWASAMKSSGRPMGRGRGFMAPPPASTGAPGGLPPPTGITPFGKRSTSGSGSGGSSFGSNTWGSPSTSTSAFASSANAVPTGTRRQASDSAWGNASGGAGSSRSGGSGWGDTQAESAPAPAVSGGDDAWGAGVSSSTAAWGESGASGWGDADDSNDGWAQASGADAGAASTSAKTSTDAVGWGDQTTSTGWGDPDDKPATPPQVDSGAANAGNNGGWGEPEPARRPSRMALPPIDTSPAPVNKRDDPPRQTPTGGWDGGWQAHESPVGREPPVSPSNSVQSGRGRETSLPRGKARDNTRTGPSPFDSLLAMSEALPGPSAMAQAEGQRTEDTVDVSGPSNSLKTYVPRDIILHEAWITYMKHIAHAVNAEQGVREAEEEAARCRALQQSKVYTQAELSETALARLDKARVDAETRLANAQSRRRQEIHALAQYADGGPSPQGDLRAEYRQAMEDTKAWLAEIRPQVEAAREAVKERSTGAPGSTSDDATAKNDPNERTVRELRERMGKADERTDDLEEYLAQLRDSTRRLVDEEFKRQNAERMDVDEGELAPHAPSTDERVESMRAQLAAMQEKLQTVQQQCDVLRAHDAEARARRLQQSAEIELLKKERLDDIAARDQALANATTRFEQVSREVHDLISSAPPAPPSLDDIHRAVAGRALDMMRGTVTQALDQLYVGVQNALREQEEEICGRVALDLQAPLLFIQAFEQRMDQDGVVDLFEPDPPSKPSVDGAEMR